MMQRSPIIKSVRLVSLKEFLLNHPDMRYEEIAGFKAYLNDIKYLSAEDWEDTYQEYKHRKL